MPANDVTVSANITANEYTITYMNGNDVLAVDTVACGDTITPIADPTMLGHTFIGWGSTLPTIMPAHNVIASPQWQVNKYRININQVQGGYVQATINDPTGNTIVIDSAEFSSWIQLSIVTNEGCVYHHIVVTDANGTVLNTANLGFLMPASDVTVTPTFTVNKYTITYIDGDNVLAVDTFAYGDTIIPIADPTREGYTFIGWTSELPTTMPANNLRVGTLWQVNSYNITVTQVTGGTITISYMDQDTYQMNYTTTDATANYEAFIYLSAEPDNGYSFSNFVVTNADGTVIETPNNYFIMPANDVNVSGTFTVKSYELTINYLYQDGTQAAPSHTDTIEYNTAYSVVSPALTGYTASQDTVMGTMGAENLTVRVIYSINNYNITVNQVTGGTISVLVENAPAITTNNTTAVFGQWVQVSCTTDNGYTLNGLVITSADGSTIEPQNNSFIMPASDVTITANVSINDYTITYMDDNNVLKVDTFTYGSTITPIADPTREGYTFIGWNPELPATMPAHNMMVNVQWQVNNYNITVTQVTGGTIYVNVIDNYGNAHSTTNDTIAAYNDWVQLSMEPDNGYSFNNFVVTNADGTVIETPYDGFFMPANDVNVSANFSITPAELSWSAESFTGYTFIDFNNWKPTLNNPNNVSVRYGCVEGNDPSQGGVEVDATTGVIGSIAAYGNIQSLPGTFHIYAVHDTDPIYYYDSVVYTLNVEQGVVVLLQQNIAEGGTATFADYTDVATLTHLYTSSSTMAFVAHDQTIRVQAEPAIGYHFGEWQAGDLVNGYTTVSTESLYTYMVPSAQSINIKAVFDTNTYVLNVVSANEVMGSVSGSTQAKHFLSYEISATPNAGYHFLQWNDGNTDNPRMVTLTEDATYEASFGLADYELVYMNGEEIFEIVTYTYGDTIDPMSAPERDGYIFIGWNPAEPITMPDSNMTLYAQWELIPCMAAENLAVANGSLTATSALITWNSSQDNSFGGVLYENGVLTEAESQLSQRWHLSELQPSTDYRVGVFAYCSLDRISDTVWLEFTTNDTCYPPVSISIDNIKAHEATLHYSFGEHVPDNYIVLISTDPDFVDPISLSTSTSAEYYPDSIVLNSIVGVELQAGTTYYLKMSSFCSIEPELISVWTETINFTTLQEYAITIDANITNGTVTADATVAAAGTVVNLTATPDNGYSFGEWVVTTINTPAPEIVTVTDNSFVMPEGGVNVSATFTPNSYKVTINQATGGVVMIILEGAAVGTTIGDSVQYNSWVRLDALTFDGYTFGDFVVTTASGNTIEVTNNGSYNGFMMPAEDVTVTATFSVNNYTITYMDGNSILAQDTFAFGANITPIANPTREGYTFTGWNPALPTTMPAEDLIVNAQWQVNSYDITINQVTGGTITVSFAGESATSYVSTTTDTSANFETWIQLSADADYGYDFVDFMVTTVSGDTLETTNNGFIMPAENVTVTAALTLHNFNITVNVSDQTPWGTVSGSGSFAYGSTDTLTATADEGYIFLGWNDLSIDNPRIITVDRDSNFIAFFIPEEIEIISNDTLMGHVNVQLPGGGHLSPNTPIVITAVPEPHYHFVSWSDGNTDNPRTIFPAQAIGLTAIFAIDQHTITATSNDINMGDVIGGGTYDYGTEISLTANALTGYVFVSWNDGNTENPRYITVEQDSTFTAIFQIQDGINDANMSNVNVYSYENQVVVANAEGFSVEIFDMSGRLVISENNVSQSVRKYIIATDGIYLVKVGNSVFKKVKIAR